MAETVLYCLAKTADTIGVFDEVVTVLKTQFGMSGVGLGASLDVSGGGNQ